MFSTWESNSASCAITTREEHFKTVFVKSNCAITLPEVVRIISTHEVLRGPSEPETSRVCLQVTSPHFSFIMEVCSLLLKPLSPWNSLLIGNVNALLFNTSK